MIEDKYCWYLQKTNTFIIANTLYPHKDSITTTLQSSDGKTYNKIDYILTPRRLKYIIKQSNTRTYPGADITSDHDGSL